MKDDRNGLAVLFAWVALGGVSVILGCALLVATAFGAVAAVLVAMVVSLCELYKHLRSSRRGGRP